MIKRLTALILAVLLLAFTAGCSVELTENQDKSGFSVNFSPKDPDTEEQTEAPAKQDSKSESKSDSKAESKSKAKSDSGTDKQSSQTTYTMADVKKLKNTGNFAKKTLEHIFDGTINGKGKATGYHYTMVTDSKGKVIDGTRSKVDENGVFTGKVEIDGVKKNGFSSFFPDRRGKEERVQLLLPRELVSAAGGRRDKHRLRRRFRRPEQSQGLDLDRLQRRSGDRYVPQLRQENHQRFPDL